MKKNPATPDTCIAVTGMPSVHDPDIKLHEVPLLVADADNFSPFGHFVRDYDKEKVIIETWPQPGWRPIEAGTGIEGGIAEGLFHFERKGALMLGRNEAVDGYYITGWFADPATASEYHQQVSYDRILVREANYHPDGGQVFYPVDGAAFIILLAPPGDHVTPDDFVAFYVGEGVGVQIKPHVWHQPVFPLTATATFWGKQGKVHACVACDMVAEFNCYLSVPLLKQS